MLRSTLVFIMFLFTLSLAAQVSTTDTRKGDVLIETSYNFVPGYGGGTGLTVLVPEGGSNVTTFGFDGGYFLSNHLALKFRLGIVSEGVTLTNVMGGVKYYAGKIPLELVVGSLSGGFSGSQFLINPKVGYAISLADNINMEPTVGAVIGDATVIQLGFGFSMFL